MLQFQLSITPVLRTTVEKQRCLFGIRPRSRLVPRRTGQFSFAYCIFWQWLVRFPFSTATPQHGSHCCCCGATGGGAEGSAAVILRTSTVEKQRCLFGIRPRSRPTNAFFWQSLVRLSLTLPRLSAHRSLAPSDCWCCGAIGSGAERSAEVIGSESVMGAGSCARLVERHIIEV